MPTRTRKRPDASHLEGEGIRSAKATRNVATVIDQQQYILRRGHCYPVDHPAVLEQPDAFAASGEDPLPGRRFRDRTPRPYNVPAAAEVTGTARCAEVDPCGWTFEGPVDAAQLQAANHVHRIDP